MSFLIDLLFPHQCVGCRKLGTLLCEPCAKTICYASEPITLNIPRLALDSVQYMAYYEGIVQEAIKLLKYQSIRDVAKLLGELLYKKTPIPNSHILTAVPLHKSRHSRRGFNQAELIARTVSKLCGTPYVELLQRTRQTPSQVSSTSREQRLHQLENIFALNPAHYSTSLQRKTVLIIDDVVTTGATLNECAIVLKRAGCAQVHGLTIAHGSQTKT